MPIGLQLYIISFVILVAIAIFIYRADKKIVEERKREDEEEGKDK